MLKVKFVVEVTDEAWKDLEILIPKEQEKAYKIFRDILSKNSFIGEKLIGKLEGNYSYRLTRKIRIIYGIDNSKKIIYIKKIKYHTAAYR
ncbi:MAG: type II toxin-antitoxin system YoeB family toxin [Candidatus Stahlbacteria bacterium]|nr:type II toxin-antitoxin system YoeB family toxin [Candidatus Stahlbacteria bacterium]